MYFTKKEIEGNTYSDVHSNNMRVEKFSYILNEVGEPIFDNIEVLEKGNNIFKRNYKIGWTYDKCSLEERARKSFERIIRNIDFSSVTSYCDVGCGYGEKVRVALEYGITHSVGVDIDDRYDEEYMDRRCEFICTDISKNRIDNRYDLVSSFCAFEHFENPIEMFTNMCEMVKPGGYLYIQFGPIWNSAYGHHCYDSIFFPYYHLLFSDSVIVNYKKKNSIIDNQYYNRWSVYDYMHMFLKYGNMELKKYNPLYNLNDLYFINAFPSLFVKYSMEDLLVSGFELIYHKTV